MTSPLDKWGSIPELYIEPKVPHTQITKLHVYDWDNTLFKSFVPNKSLYNPVTFNRIQRDELSGYSGWWNDSKLFNILIQMAQIENNLIEYWNSELLKLCLQSNESDNTISIVMTGRKEALFKNHFKNIIAMTKSKHPELTKHVQFNAVLLKKLIPQEFDGVDSIKDLNTTDYKNKVLADFIQYYPNLQEVTIYDDRVSQVNSFKRFFQTQLEKTTQVEKLQWFVIPIVPQISFLPPPLEYDLLRYNCYLVNETIKKECIVRPMVRLFEKSSNYGYYLSHITQLKLYSLIKEQLQKYYNVSNINIVNLNKLTMFIPTHEKSQNWSLGETVKCLKPSHGKWLGKSRDNRSSTKKKNLKFLQKYQTDMIHDAIRFKGRERDDETEVSMFMFKFKLNKLLFRQLDTIELDEYDYQTGTKRRESGISVEVKLNIEPMGHAYTQYKNFFITLNPHAIEIPNDKYDVINLGDIEINTQFGCKREMRLKIQQF